MYSVLQGPDNDGQTGSRCKVHLLRSNKYFAKKPILQLAVVPEHQILISLSGLQDPIFKHWEIEFKRHFANM